MLPNSREKKVQRDIPRSKQMRRYPSVLIGRLGINVEFAHRGISSELMEFIKSWFIDAGNKTYCRFLIVDTYNKEKIFPKRSERFLSSLTYDLTGKDVADGVHHHGFRWNW